MAKTTYAQPLPTWKKISLFIIALAVLLTTYIFQRVDYFNTFIGLLSWQTGSFHPYTAFIFNKTLRLIVNDLACFVLIYIFFQDPRYLKVAFLVFLFELLVLLPVYFLLKLSLEGDAEISSPLLSQFHRLIINPTLMILLMIGFFYQRFVVNRTHG